MTLLDEGLVDWKGRELHDANGERIGSIVGLGYPRRRFGTVWLLVDTGTRRTLVPEGQIRPFGDRLILPYPRPYVESAVVVEEGRRLTQAQARRLCLHYGIEYGSAGACSQGCGLCRARKAGVDAA